MGRETQHFYTHALFGSLFLEVYLIIWLLLDYPFHHGPTSPNNIAHPRCDCAIEGQYSGVGGALTVTLWGSIMGAGVGVESTQSFKSENLY